MNYWRIMQVYANGRMLVLKLDLLKRVCHTDSTLRLRQTDKPVQIDEKQKLKNMKLKLRKCI